MLSCSFLNVKFPFFSIWAVEEHLRHFEEITFLTFKHQDLRRRILLFFQRRRFRLLVFFNGKRERESAYSLVHGVRFKRFSFRLNGRL